MEAQLSRDPGKQWSWPIYLATLRGRLECPTVLLVVCVDATVATWCATPIELGHPGARLCPLVLGPDLVPVVTDVEEAVRFPELAVLSAMAHGGDPGGHEVLEALLGVFAVVDPDLGSLYHEVVLAVLPVAAQHYLEALMASRTYEYQSEFARRYFFKGEAKGKTEGEVKGKAGAVIAVLDSRGIDVASDARARITECSDLDQLDTWVRRAAIISTVQDLFD